MPLSRSMASRLCCVEPLEFLNALQGLTGSWDLAQPLQQSLLFFIYWGFAKDCSLQKGSLRNPLLSSANCCFSGHVLLIRIPALHIPCKHVPPPLRGTCWDPWESLELMSLEWGANLKSSQSRACFRFLFFYFTGWDLWWDWRCRREEPVSLSASIWQQLA